MQPAGDIAIRAVDLSKRYRSGDDELVVFAGLGLEVRRGEMLAIVGESGAGKVHAAPSARRAGPAHGRGHLLRSEGHHQVRRLRTGGPP